MFFVFFNTSGLEVGHPGRRLLQLFKQENMDDGRWGSAILGKVGRIFGSKAKIKCYRLKVANYGVKVFKDDFWVKLG